MKRYLTLLLLFLSFFTSSLVHAEWKKEVNKKFSGETATYYVNRANNGAEIVVDVQQEHIAFVHSKTVINYVTGIKLDGIFYKETGRSGGGDDFSDAVFLRKNYSPESWDKFLDAKKIEVNVEYFKMGERASTFLSGKSLRSTFPKQFTKD